MGSGVKNQSGSFGEDDIEGCGRHFVFPGERGLLGAGRWVGEDWVTSSREEVPTVARCQRGQGQVHRLVQWDAEVSQR